jgi:tRNA/tmRNA/rRNA uracil-C5-methylase (TrmA/RlmC/RlmD family)
MAVSEEILIKMRELVEQENAKEEERKRYRQAIIDTFTVFDPQKLFDFCLNYVNEKNIGHWEKVYKAVQSGVEELVQHYWHYTRATLRYLPLKEQWASQRWCKASPHYEVKW